MPLIYRKVCQTCDTPGSTDMTFDGFNATVVWGEDVGGEIICSEFWAYINDDNELVPLPHPGEFDALEEQGATWEGAIITGRLVRVHHLICRDCGEQNQKLSLSCKSGIGCLAGLLLAIGVFICLSLFSDLNGVIEFIPVFGAVLLPNAILWCYLHIRFRQHLQPFQFKGCRECGSRRHVSVSNANREQLLCPRCGERTVRVRVAGIS